MMLALAQDALGMGESSFTLLAVLSVVLSVGALCCLALFVMLIPTNYFLGSKSPEWPFKTRHPWLNVGIVIGKNVLGVLLLVAGLVFLALPGQGLLTLLVSLMLLDFPGKRVLEIRLVKRPKVLRTLNWIRKKLGCEPFEVGE